MNFEVTIILLLTSFNFTFVRRYILTVRNQQKNKSEAFQFTKKYL